MQKQKDDIRDQILKAAAGIFRRKGYAGTSMRDIATAAGVTLSNIYNYFGGGKDELFRCVVRPVVHAFEAMLHEHHGRRGHDILEMQSEAYLRYVVQEYLLLIRRHRSLLTLLLFQAQGSSLEHFKEDFTDKATILVKDYFRNMKEKHPALEVDISDFSIHLHTVWMFALFEEMLRHKVRTEELEQVVTEYITLETAGWRKLMNI